MTGRAWPPPGPGTARAASAYANPEHPFRLQGSADLNSYKMFAEVFWNLLRDDGRIGVILPTGIYSDFGTKDLRETLLFERSAGVPLRLPEREEGLLCG